MKKIIILLFVLQPFIFLSQKIGINLADMDSAINPRNDFYNFCNGTWQKKFVLPESDSRYGSFNVINDNNLKNIKLILDVAAKNTTAKANSNAQKLRDFYNTAMDTVKLNQSSYSPIKKQLQQIDQVNSIEDLIILKSIFDFYGVSLFFTSSVSPDSKNSRKNSFVLSQSGTGLEDRDYYFSAQYDSVRIEYKQYLSRLFELTDNSKKISVANANLVFEFEKLLSEKAFTRIEMRDPEVMYNVFSKKTLSQLVPAVDWVAYFKEKKINQPDTIIIEQVDYFKNLNSLLTSTPIETLKIYAKAQLLMCAAPFLSNNFEKVDFDFFGKVLSGANEMKPRWQRVHSVMNSAIGDIVSEQYVKKYFTPKAKAKVNSLIDNLILAYRERIASRTWMDASTKKQANKKLDLLIRKVGYPDKWKDYSKLNITTESYWANYINSSTHEINQNLAELKKPVDRTKWQITPVTVNAYYDPTTNEIAFPAAILQPPFFDVDADDAANYGTMGAIIGHELTHGFDDQGAQFDANGNMNMWWTKQDYSNFKAKTLGIVNQFNNYVAIDTIKLNGSMTQGENIADLGGLTMAYYAYKKSLKGKPSQKMAGYTGEQRFFIAWCQGWKTVCRDAELKRLLTIDYHSPGYYRAFAPLTNLKEFYQAFNVKEGDKMYTPESNRVEIW